MLFERHAANSCSVWKGLADTAQARAWKACFPWAFICIPSSNKMVVVNEHHGVGKTMKYKMAFKFKQIFENHLFHSTQLRSWHIFPFPSKTGHPHHAAWWLGPASGTKSTKDCSCFAIKFRTRSSTYKQHVWAPDNLLQFLFVWVVWEVEGKRGGQHQAGTVAGLNLFLR